MHERDAVPVGAFARLFIDEADAAGFELLECFWKVRDAVGDVVQAGSTLGEESAYGGVGVGWLDELDLPGAAPEENELDPLVEIRLP